MNSRILQVALRIALIQEEFSEEEILEGVNLLKEKGGASELLAYLSGNKAKKRVSQLSSRTSRKKVSHQSENSPIPTNLKTENPEKYVLLTDFENSIKKGEILSDSIEIRRLGESLNKGFYAKNSRIDLINQLLKLLVPLSVEEIKNFIAKINQVPHNVDEYQQLANFIIEGNSSKKQENEEK